MDVSKLGGEWHHSNECLFACVTSQPDGQGAVLATFKDAIVECERLDAKNLASFAALARNALDVMMRRGWIPSREYPWSDPKRFGDAVWLVRHPRTKDSIGSGGDAYHLEIGPIVGPLGMELIWATDPFTALIKADAWYREQVGAK